MVKNLISVYIILCFFSIAASFILKSSKSATCSFGGTPSTYDNSSCLLYVNKPLDSDSAQNYCNLTYKGFAAGVQDAFENKIITGTSMRIWS